MIQFLVDMMRALPLRQIPSPGHWDKIDLFTY